MTKFPKIYVWYCIQIYFYQIYNRTIYQLSQQIHFPIRRVPPLEQELLTLLGHLSSPPVFSGARFTRSLVECVCFVDRCLSFCLISLGHCVVCPSSIYAFWLPLWYLQTLLITENNFRYNVTKFNVQYPLYLY